MQDKIADDYGGMKSKFMKYFEIMGLVWPTLDKMGKAHMAQEMQGGQMDAERKK